MFPKIEEDDCQEGSPETVITSPKQEAQDLNTKEHFSCFSITPPDVAGLLYENIETNFLPEQSILAETSCCSPHHQFLSPTTAESQCPLDDFVLGHSTSPDFAEVISFPGSDLGMQIGDLDSFHEMNFDYWK